jgi:hypothetical protein
MQQTIVNFTNSSLTAYKIDAIEELDAFLMGLNVDNESITLDWVNGLLSIYAYNRGYFMTFKVLLMGETHNICGSFKQMQPSSCIIEGVPYILADLTGYQGRYREARDTCTVNRLLMEEALERYKDTLADLAYTEPF